jgi:hypothetical protein
MIYFQKSFWLALVLYAINQIAEDSGILVPLLYSYLDDILCPLIVLGFTLTFQQQITYRNPNYTFSYGHVLTFIIVYSVLYEVVFPADDNRHFSDPWDIMAYTAGGVIFYKFGNKQVKTLFLKKRRNGYQS